MVPITTNPIIQEMIAAGPAIDDASQAPNNQPEPINDLIRVTLTGAD